MGAIHSTFEVRDRAVAALRRGMSVTDVSSAYGAERTTVYRWRKRFEQDGVKGLKRRIGSGRPRTLTDLPAEHFAYLATRPASKFGFETDLWTATRLQIAVREIHKLKVSKQTIWRRLREADLTYQKPERAYHELDESKRQEWIKKVVPRIRHAVKKHRAILYFQDESNVSLTALLGKTWAPRGQTPKIKVTGKRGSVAAMSAVSRRGNLLFRLHQNRIASREVIGFLKQMLIHHHKRHLVVVMDQAPPHTSKKTTAFIEAQSRLHVFHLPKYSPDWNPDEKVWNFLKHEKLKGHQAKTKEELRELTHRKLKSMARQPGLMRGIFFRCCIAELFI
jgi:transposase